MHKTTAVKMTLKCYKKFRFAILYYTMNTKILNFSLLAQYNDLDLYLRMLNFKLGLHHGGSFDFS